MTATTISQSPGWPHDGGGGDGDGDENVDVGEVIRLSLLLLPLSPLSVLVQGQGGAVAAVDDGVVGEDDVDAGGRTAVVEIGGGAVSPRSEGQQIAGGDGLS